MQPLLAIKDKGYLMNEVYIKNYKLQFKRTFYLILSKNMHSI